MPLGAMGRGHRGGGTCNWGEMFVGGNAIGWGLRGVQSSGGAACRQGGSALGGPHMQWGRLCIQGAVQWGAMRGHWSSTMEGGRHCIGGTLCEQGSCGQGGSAAAGGPCLCIGPVHRGGCTHAMGWGLYACGGGLGGGWGV